MKRILVKLTLVSSGAVMAASAFAQSPAPRAHVAAATTSAAPAAPAAPSARAASARATASTDVTDAPPERPQAVNTRPASTASATRVTAAGSVIVILADGIVANAAIAQIQPPAPGFVFER